MIANDSHVVRSDYEAATRARSATVSPATGFLDPLREREARAGSDRCGQEGRSWIAADNALQCLSGLLRWTW